MLEAYPTRIDYEDIHGRYAKLMGPEIMAETGDEPAAFCEAVALACEVKKTHTSDDDPSLPPHPCSLLFASPPCAWLALVGQHERLRVGSLEALPQGWLRHLPRGLGGDGPRGRRPAAHGEDCAGETAQGRGAARGQLGARLVDQEEVQGTEEGGRAGPAPHPHDQGVCYLMPP